MTRNAVLSAFLLALAACSSGGPRTPSPPVVVPDPDAGTVTLHWEPVAETQLGTPLEDVTGYVLTITGDSGVQQSRTYSTAGTYRLPLEPGRYRLELQAISATLGPSDPSSAVFVEATSAGTTVSGNPGEHR